MKKIEFKEQIKASPQKVYETMLGLNDKSTYEEWTAEFNPTSTYEGNWDKGGKIYFLATDENGKIVGMVSEIAENIPNKYVSIRHIGMLEGKKEITSGEQVDSWSGALENYRFDENKGITTVTIELETAEEYISYFTDTWSKALKKLKRMVEK